MVVVGVGEKFSEHAERKNRAARSIDDISGPHESHAVLAFLGTLCVCRSTRAVADEDAGVGIERHGRSVLRHMCRMPVPAPVLYK